MIRSSLIWMLLFFMHFATAQESKPIKILALGDSYTIGQSVDVDRHWPNQLLELLAKNNVEVRLKIIA